MLVWMIFVSRERWLLHMHKHSNYMILWPIPYRLFVCCHWDKKLNCVHKLYYHFFFFHEFDRTMKLLVIDFVYMDTDIFLCVINKDKYVWLGMTRTNQNHYGIGPWGWIELVPSWWCWRRWCPEISVQLTPCQVSAADAAAPNQQTKPSYHMFHSEQFCHSKKYRPSGGIL